MPSGKREAATFHWLSALAAAQPEEIRARRTAAETAYTGVLGRLGAPGTYEAPQMLGGEAAPAAGAPTDAAEAWQAPSIFQTGEAQTAAARAVDPRYKKYATVAEITKLDPEEYVKSMEGTAQFRIASRLTAEAEQLIAREGPLYQEMMNSLQLPILEGAGAMARENAEALKRAAARGGAARRTAFEAVQRIRSQERINSQKVMAIAQTRFALDQWARENARTTLEFGQNWAANLGGIRDSYNNAMDRASELMLNSALPIMFKSKQEAAKWRYYAHGKNRAKVTRWVDGILGVVSMGAGAMGGGPGMVGAGAGLLAGAMGGPRPPV